MTDVEVQAQLLFEGVSRDHYFVSFQGRQFAEVRVGTDSDLLLIDLTTGRSSRCATPEELSETLVSLVRIHLIR